MTWREFEVVCLAYLRQRYSPPGVEYHRHGESNSTKSDIEVTTPKGTFYIEAKMPIAQAGQFVVLFDADGFVFSPLNKDFQNEYSNQLINIMNSSPEVYADPGTKGSPLLAPQSQLVGWVETHYQNKNVKFLISQNNAGYFVIIPVDKIGEYFKVSAIYRVKRSGSSYPSLANTPEIRKAMGNSITDLNFVGKRLIVRAEGFSDKDRVIGNNYTYQLNLIRPNTFEVRRLSNTANANVIFSVELKQEQDPKDLATFVSKLKS
jgi:hypothetical protein